MNTPVETFRNNQRTSARWVEASAVVAATLAALAALAAASSHSAQPAHAAAYRAEVPELRALERHLQRSGTLSGYQILF